MFLVSLGSLAAHELGAIRVLAELKKDGTYTVDCIVDREHLPPDFAARARYPPKAGRIRGIRRQDEASIGRLLSAVADRVRLEFDGKLQRPRKLEWVDPDPMAAEVILRLSGAIPRGASLFAFANDARIGTYLLTVIRDGSETVRQWQEGGEDGLAVVLRTDFVPSTATAR